MNAAIIPARGGSKRIPRKNVKEFAGRPMIAWPITAALESGVFDKVVVSTDSDEIARTAEKWGAEVPFMRPEELSDDHTPTAPVLVHAVECLREQGVEVENGCCIYATAPFVRSEYLREGLETLTEKNVTTVFSVTSFAFPIFRSLKINEFGALEMFWPEHAMTRSQDLPEAYHDAGQFYWFNCRKFLAEPKLYAVDSLPVVLPRHLVQDIDTPEDWVTAENMFRALALNNEEEQE